MEGHQREHEPIAQALELPAPARLSRNDAPGFAPANPSAHLSLVAADGFRRGFAGSPIQSEELGSGGFELGARRRGAGRRNHRDR